MLEPGSFEGAALAMHRNGYSVLPITPHNATFSGHGKAPGTNYPMARWQNYCIERASIHMTAAWGRRADSYGGGIGVATGFGGLIAIDIDDDSLIEPLLAVLPPVAVGKIGRKGLTTFCRTTEPLPSKPYRTPGKRGLLDFLSGGKQTVLPPSIHPDTGEPYRWTTERTLLDTPLADLPEFTASHHDAMEEVLRQFGWAASEPAEPHSESVGFSGGSDSASAFRDVNDAALSNLRAWVPELGLKRCYPAGSGFKAVAPWRASGSGRAFHLRDPNLSFDRTGIRDFGEERGYSPIDVVIAALNCTESEALNWLAPLVGVQLHDPEAAALAERIVASARKKKVR